MKNDVHHIQKLRLELIFADQQDADDRTDAIAGIQKSAGLKRMSQIFDDMVPAGRKLKLDHLFIDMGRLGGAWLEEDFVSRLGDALERALRNALVENDTLKYADEVSFKEENIIYYLKNGHFPWISMDDQPAGHSASSQPASALVAVEIPRLLSASPGFARLFQHTLQNDSNALSRWLRRFPHTLLQNVKTILLESAGDLKATMRQSIAVMEELQMAGIPVTVSEHEHTQRIVWVILCSDDKQQILYHLRGWLMALIPPLPTENRQQFGQWFDATVAVGFDETVALLLRHKLLFSKKPGQVVAQLLKEPRRKVLQQQIKSDKGENTPEKVHNVLSETGTIQPASRLPKENSRAGRAAETPLDLPLPAHFWQHAGENAVEYYIDNAGLVLLAPFVEHFFEKMGVNTQNKLADDQAASLGVQLLQYLAVGTWEDEESHLLLPKILCGRQPEWPLFGNTPRPETLETESSNLLESAIGHWKSLRNTATGGLREGFLQRAGKISQENGGWRLQVETAAIDILLQHIPWTFSVIRYPWMPAPLYVEW